MKETNNKEEFKKRLYNFVVKILKFIDKLPSDRITIVVVNQVIRSATSILGNYVEAQSAASKKEFTNYFNISLRSTKETMMWLVLLRDTGKVSKEEITEFLQELEELSKIFTASIITAKKKGESKK